MEKENNTEKSADAQWDQLQPYLNAAQRSVACAMHVLMNVDGAESEIAIHLIRGWYSLACVIAVEAGRDLPGAADFLSGLDPADAAWSRQLTAEQWRKDLQAWQGVAEQPPWKEIEAGAVTLHSLRNHCDVLETALGKLAARLRRKYGRTLWQSRLLRRLIAAVVVLAVCCGIVLLVRSLVVAPPAWRAQFFDRRDFNAQPVKVVYHRDIDFKWGMNAPFFKFPADNFAVRWESCLTLEQPQEIVFVLGSDDGSRLKIDKRLVIDHWGFHGFEEKRGQVRLEAGVHHLQVEYFEAGGGALITLQAEPAAVLQQAALQRPGADKKNPCELRKDS